MGEERLNSGTTCLWSVGLRNQCSISSRCTKHIGLFSCILLDYEFDQTNSSELSCWQVEVVAVSMRLIKSVNSRQAEPKVTCVTYEWSSWPLPNCVLTLPINSIFPQKHPMLPTFSGKGGWSKVFVSSVLVGSVWAYETWVCCLHCHSLQERRAYRSSLKSYECKREKAK